MKRSTFFSGKAFCWRNKAPPEFASNISLTDLKKILISAAVPVRSIV